MSGFPKVEMSACGGGFGGARTMSNKELRGRATQKSVNISSDATVAERLRALGYAGGDTQPYSSGRRTG
jgi:hypothetical protein